MLAKGLLNTLTGRLREASLGRKGEKQMNIATRNSGKPWTRTQRVWLFDLVCQGRPLRIISFRIGRSEKAVAAEIRRIEALFVSFQKEGRK